MHSNFNSSILENMKLEEFSKMLCLSYNRDDIELISGDIYHPSQHI